MNAQSEHPERDIARILAKHIEDDWDSVDWPVPIAYKGKLLLKKLDLDQFTEEAKHLKETVLINSEVPIIKITLVNRSLPKYKAGLMNGVGVWKEVGKPFYILSLRPDNDGNCTYPELEFSKIIGLLREYRVANIIADLSGVS